MSPVVFQRLLQLPPLLVDIPQVGISLGQKRVLLDGQSAEVSRPANIPSK